MTELEQNILDSLEGHPRVGPDGTRFVREFYDAVRSKMAGKDNFIDASRILNGRAESDFYDFGHTAAQTAPIIGEKIAHMILPRVKTKDRPGLPGRVSAARHEH